MTRANKARIFDSAVDFVDASRKPPLEIGAIATPARQEEPTEANEIVIQFLAFSRIAEQLTKFNGKYAFLLFNF